LLADHANALGDEIVVLKEGRRAVAAIVPLKNVDRESLALSQHPKFLRIIARARAQLAAGRTLSLAAMKRAVLPRSSSRRRRKPTPRKARHD
jgi:antitoxin (DNA-binding transcriptional repressor) of toxin-antitoxin stability system